MYIAIGLLSSIIGFLVGASATPVVGIALPALFGFIGTGIALFQQFTSSPEKKDANEQIKLLEQKSAQEGVDSSTQEQLEIKKGEANTLQKQEQKRFNGTIIAVAMLLIFFALFFSGGVFGGQWARLSQAYDRFLPREYTVVPWEEDTNLEPPTTPAQLQQWIAFQRLLADNNYSPEAVESNYGLLYNQWEKDAQPTPSSASIWDDLDNSTSPLKDNALVLRWITLEASLRSLGYDDATIVAIYKAVGDGLEEDNLAQYLQAYASTVSQSEDNAINTRSRENKTVSANDTVTLRSPVFTNSIIPNPVPPTVAIPNPVPPIVALPNPVLPTGVLPMNPPYEGCIMFPERCITPQEGFFTYQFQ